ncbi:hypothetical protein CHELA20_52816 [Hyphomicrobiales bacterium]|nr:hypothetical protein CHELA41_22109 [Hyphomicrobiales bacterium]CAH1683006.1 hypothetical protein CHELA20_52816 [Hyphomicrobiales bacterium]
MLLAVFARSGKSFSKRCRLLQTLAEHMRADGSEPTRRMLKPKAYTEQLELACSPSPVT